MAGRRGWFRKTGYVRVEVPEDGVFGHVAAAVEIPEAMIEGYLVVAFLVGGEIGVAHNSCCLPHVMSRVARRMTGSAGLMAPRPAHDESHTK